MRSAAVVVLAAGCLLVCLVELTTAHLCSDCECLPESSSLQLCARQQGSGKYRGFRSRCELDCANRCRKDKYLSVAKGRCGKYLASIKSRPVALTTDERVPAEGSIFGPLLNLLLQAAPSS